MHSDLCQLEERGGHKIVYTLLSCPIGCNLSRSPYIERHSCGYIFWSRPLLSAQTGPTFTPGSDNCSLSSTWTTIVESDPSQIAWPRTLVYDCQEMMKQILTFSTTCLGMLKQFNRTSRPPSWKLMPRSSCNLRKSFAASRESWKATITLCRQYQDDRIQENGAELTIPLLSRWSTTITLYLTKALSNNYV